MLRAGSCNIGPRWLVEANDGIGQNCGKDIGGTNPGREGEVEKEFLVTCSNALTYPGAMVVEFQDALDQVEKPENALLKENLQSRTLDNGGPYTA